MYIDRKKIVIKKKHEPSEDNFSQMMTKLKSGVTA